MPSIINKIIIIIFFFLLAINSYAQLRVYERKSGDIRNDEFIYNSDYRAKINLNGAWKISSDNKNFYDIRVPFATDHNKTIYLIKEFTVNDTLLKNHNFLFIAEGINYYSEVKINDVIVSRSSGGRKYITTEIQEGLIREKNIITIKIDNELDNQRTLPLEKQVNYGKNYQGITANICLQSVPKIFISDLNNYIKFETATNVRITSKIKINTYDIEQYIFESDVFDIKTEIVNKSNNETVAESNTQKINLKAYQSNDITTEMLFKNPELWSIENPNLYYIKCSISNSDRTFDNLITEMGFCNIQISNNEFYVNGKKFFIKGINYFEDSPQFADALEYSETERDLLKIKDLGFNTIRVPGKSVHPFITKICNRIGLFLLEDIPFNEVPYSLLKDEKYIKEALDYFENVVQRDKDSPAILMWGIGNNFDVTSDAAAKYAENIKQLAGGIDGRKLYYTSRSKTNDKVKEIIDVKGLNLYPDDFGDEKTKSFDINSFTFISSYGIEVVNGNRNGYGDKKSEEYQAKKLAEFTKTFDKKNFILSSFADYNSESPIINNFDYNPYLRTNGIFTFWREQKYSAGILKRVLNNQNFQKIPEGTEISLTGINNNYVIIISIAIILLFVIIASKLRYFKESIMKSFSSHKNTRFYIKEESGISNIHSFILAIFISASISIYVTSILSLFYFNPDFDLLLSKVFSNDNIKIVIADIIDSTILTFMVLTLIIFIKLILMVLLIQILNLFIKKNIKFNKSLSLVIYSFSPMLILLPLGMFISKLDNTNLTFIYITIFTVIFILFFAYYKIISGLRYIYDFSYVKTYAIGFSIILVIFLIFYYYLFYYKSISNYLNLIKSFN